MILHIQNCEHPSVGRRRKYKVLLPNDPARSRLKPDRTSTDRTEMISAPILQFLTLFRDLFRHAEP